MPDLTITLPFMVKPQGSKKAFQRGGKINLVESSPGLKKLRNEASAMIARAADGWIAPDPETPISVVLMFTIEKPRSVKREYPTIPPDLDKLQRFCLDAVTDAQLYGTKVWDDDSQVCEIVAVKNYGFESQTRIEVSYE